MEIKKSLDLSITMTNDRVAVTIFEPSTSQSCTVHAPLSFDEHPEFDEHIGREIYEYLRMWYDAARDDT